MIRQWFIVRMEGRENVDPNRLHNALEHLGIGVEVIEVPEADQEHFNRLVDINNDRKREMGYPV